MPNVEADIEEVKPGVTVERAKGYPPRRVDKRSILEMLHQEIGEKLGKNKDRRVGVDGKGLMEAVDEAVTGAPAPGPHNDY